MSDKQTAIDALEKALEVLVSAMKPMHLKVAQGIAAGKNQSQAYRDAGGRSKRSDRASTQLVKNNPSISEYAEIAKKIAALKSQEELIANVGAKRKLLWDIALSCSEELEETKDSAEGPVVTSEMKDPKAAISAVAELNKMDGDLAAIKTENKHMHDFSELSDSELDAEIERTRQEAGVT